MAKRKQTRPQRKRIFVGCEGESERGYIRLISEFADQLKIPLHFDTHDCSGGDHLSVIEQSIATMQFQERNRGRYVYKAVFLDGDLRSRNHQRTQQANVLINRHGIMPVWSNPCIEVTLLRHLPDCLDLSPQTSVLAQREIVKKWPEYSKPMAANELRRRITYSSLQNVASRDGELRSFLTRIGFPTIIA